MASFCIIVSLHIACSLSINKNNLGRLFMELCYLRKIKVLTAIKGFHFGLALCFLDSSFFSISAFSIQIYYFHYRQLKFTAYTHVRILRDWHNLSMYVPVPNKSLNILKYSKNSLVNIKRLRSGMFSD